MTNLGASPAELAHLATLDVEQGPKGQGITGHQGCPEMDLTQVVEHDGSHIVTYDDIIAAHDQAIYDSLKELDDADDS
jgi:hypothetical protein